MYTNVSAADSIVEYAFLAYADVNTASATTTYVRDCKHTHANVQNFAIQQNIRIYHSFVRIKHISHPDQVDSVL